ncbi:MAG TPA: sugar ABC transporter ATP-binding protein [Methylomirabilota bacterium]|nr:sugar ABC transporter ATP-binding protein [Methylomirabilota bacterium]
MAFLAFQNISKSFPGVQALDNVSLEIERGSCHALMGENGAGKSTLGKILAGVYRADSGEILLDGKPIKPMDPLAARRLGISMVHQELAFCPNLSVAENLCLGDLPRAAGWVNRRQMRAQATAMLEQIQADIDVDAQVGALSTGQEQLVQIAAAIGSGARVIVMDEPTSSLSTAESERLFRLIPQLQSRGITIIYVSHRMEEIFHLCDTISVLRDGRHVATQKREATSPDRVIQHMIGRELAAYTPAHVSRNPGPALLEVRQLSSPGKFNNLSFQIREGEIVGMAGLIGSGRSEAAQAIFGLDPAATGEVYVAGKRLEGSSVDEALAHGLGFLPEDRKRLGLVLTMNCRENTSLAALKSLTRGGFLQLGKERSLAEEYSARLRVKTPHIDAPIAGLSGGNQQKIALAKWLALKCKTLIVDEPTRGVDVGAKAEIHQLLDQLACHGCAILLISSELPEVMALSTRLLVMRHGQIAGELERASLSEERVMRLMAGL